METITPELRQVMQKESQGITQSFIQQTQNLGGLLVMDVGPRGGGKTTKAVNIVQFYREVEPEVRRVSNVPIENAYYYPNILKFLATKLITEGGDKPYQINPDGTVHIIKRKTIPPKMLVIVDETAITGLEARGSGMYALNTYLLALSRKLNVDCELISQLMSMADKRAQWLSDFYTLCEAFPDLGYFRYRNYDSEFHKTTTARIDFEFARENLFPKFDTTDIPNYDELALSFRAFYQISDDDMKLYEDIRDGKPHIQPGTQVEKPVERYYLDRKSMRPPMGRYPGETVVIDNHRYEVLQRDWLSDSGKYRYRLREIPDYTAYTESMDESGLDPLEESEATA